MSGLALVLAAASILLSSWLFTRIQTQRTESLVRACLRDSDQSRAIIAFLDELGSKPATVDKARGFFPVLTIDECEARAEESVGPPPGK